MSELDRIMESIDKYLDSKGLTTESKYFLCKKALEEYWDQIQDESEEGEDPEEDLSSFENPEEDLEDDLGEMEEELKTEQKPKQSSPKDDIGDFEKAEKKKDVMKLIQKAKGKKDE